MPAPQYEAARIGCHFDTAHGNFSAVAPVGLPTARFAAVRQLVHRARGGDAGILQSHRPGRQDTTLLQTRSVAALLRATISPCPLFQAETSPHRSAEPQDAGLIRKGAALRGIKALRRPMTPTVRHLNGATTPYRRSARRMQAQCRTTIYETSGTPGKRWPGGSHM